MGIYTRRARRDYAADVRDYLIPDSPSTVTRTRKSHPDKFRDPVEEVAGPFTVRIEEFRSTRNPVVFDEKGTGSTTAYILLGVDIPRWQDTEKKVPTFKLDDRLTDQDGNVYKVTSPARWDGAVVSVNIELLG